MKQQAAKPKETPLLFTGPMVLALGWETDPKTETRRVINRLRGKGNITQFGPTDTPGYDWHFRDKGMRWHDVTSERLAELCPYGNPGDLLWGREAWRQYDGEHDSGPGQSIGYAADDHPYHKAHGICWRPSIHMPRWACRIWLEITEIYPEPLHAITDEGAKAEGIRQIIQSPEPGWGWESGGPCFDTPVLAYAALWDQINKKRGYPWKNNDYVWVIKFKQQEPR